MYPTAVNTIRTSRPYRQTIQFDVFHGRKHDGIPECAQHLVTQLTKAGLKMSDL